MIKLTDPDGYTRRGKTGETLWTPGQTVAPTGVGSTPCGPGVLHAYASPEVAVLGDPIHARLLPGGRCFSVELAAAGGMWETDGLKRWTTSPLRVVEEVPIPKLPLLERVAWAIIIARHPCTREWAVGWLSGRDRSEAAAVTAEAEAWAVAYAAAAEAAWSAAWAARAAQAAAAAEEFAAAEAAEAAAAESRLMPALARARAILAGEWPADRYDET